MRKIEYPVDFAEKVKSVHSTSGWGDGTIRTFLDEGFENLHYEISSEGERAAEKLTPEYIVKAFENGEEKKVYRDALKAVKAPELAKEIMEEQKSG